MATGFRLARPSLQLEPSSATGRAAFGVLCNYNNTWKLKLVRYPSLRLSNMGAGVGPIRVSLAAAVAHRDREREDIDKDVAPFEFDDRDLESNQSLWNLYARWRKHFNVSHDNPTTLNVRFDIFKEDVICAHMTQKLMAGIFLEDVEALVPDNFSQTQAYTLKSLFVIHPYDNFPNISNKFSTIANPIKVSQNLTRFAFHCLRCFSPRNMDPKFFDAIRKNDIATFSSLVKENEGILNQRTADSFSTPLHLASKYGCTEMVSEIVRLCPDMVSVENKNLETPIHEACRQENVKVLMLLLDANPTAACNPTCKSAFSLACSHGHLDMVNRLLNLSDMVGPGVAGFDQTCIHIAASRGHTDVVRELLNKWPELTHVIDDNGNSPLHHACNKGHREIVWILLRRDPNLALQVNNNGYSPLHLAVMNGKVSILDDFVSGSAASFHYLTREEETVFHLAVRYGCYDALVFLVQVSNGTNLLHCQDRYGNSVLHLAVIGGRHKIAEFLINKTKLDINTRNSEWMTALDILDQAKDSAENRQLQATFIRAGGKRSIQSSSRLLEVDRANSLSPVPSWLSLSRRYQANELKVSNEVVSFDCITPPEVSSKSTDSRSPQPQVSKRLENGTYKPYYFSPTILGEHKHQSKRQMKDLNQLYYTQKNKYHEMHTEALLNARNTIILVAILIATVTFAAGISPPGGVYQDGPMKGKSMVGKTTAFKVFAISNNVALFTSLSIVIVLVSIIPFRRKPHMRLLTIAHKVMWVAVAFMGTGYVAATWVILPHSQGMQWLSVVLLALGGGSLGTIFSGLSVMLVEHWLRKSKWRKTRKESGDGAADLERESQNSDVESSYLQGYHSY